MPLFKGWLGDWLNRLWRALGWMKERDLFDKNGNPVRGPLSPGTPLFDAKGNPVSLGAARELDRAAGIEPPRPWDRRR